MTSVRYVALIFTAVGVLAGAAEAQRPAVRAQAPSAGLLLTPRARSAALAAIKATLQRDYVIPELRAKLVERLAQGERAKRYEIAEPMAFADRITEDLRDASRDGHLFLRFSPDEYAAAIAPRASGRGDDQDAERAARDHQGLTELRILPGNLRYLKIASFMWVPDKTGFAYDDAMRFLAGGDAAIIDLRGNGGGHPLAVQYLISHFLDPDVPLMTFSFKSEPPVHARTLAHLATRLKHKPLYVLIDAGSFSAAEEAAYHVQQFKLGELVGEKTGGGANNNEFFPIAPGFLLSVSVGRPVHPVSGTNWDGAGVSPTTAAASAAALDVAQARALARLGREPKATPAQRADYAWALAGVEGRLHPVLLTPQELAPHGGTYGEHVVAVRGDALWMTRGQRPSQHLRPLDRNGLFEIDGRDALRVRFTRRGLELLRRGDPAPRVFARTAASPGR